ncbi:MAG: hypothetical protein U5L45_20500 [Saprospiraceae bacterium]|nr:hypothetical protein [Saprospiraceae bacterium]
MKKELSTTWSYAEFHAFVLFYAANADSRITSDEIALIRTNLTEVQYLDIESAFKSHSDATVLNHILTYKDRYFATQTDRERLLADMQAVFNADNNFSTMERNMQRIFQIMI